MTPRMHLAFDREHWWDERYGVDGPRRSMSKSECAALLGVAARECRNPLVWVATPNWSRWLKGGE